MCHPKTNHCFYNNRIHQPSKWCAIHVKDLEEISKSLDSYPSLAQIAIKSEIDKEIAHRQ